MSCSGSPGTAVRSANFPGSTLPTRSLQPMISAFRLVAATMHAIGASPSWCRTSHSFAFAPWSITIASVAKPIGMPDASARLNPPYSVS